MRYGYLAFVLTLAAMLLGCSRVDQDKLVVARVQAAHPGARLCAAAAENGTRYYAFWLGWPPEQSCRLFGSQDRHGYRDLYEENFSDGAKPMGSIGIPAKAAADLEAALLRDLIRSAGLPAVQDAARREYEAARVGREYDPSTFFPEFLAVRDRLGILPSGYIPPTASEVVQAARAEEKRLSRMQNSIAVDLLSGLMAREKSRASRLAEPVARLAAEKRVRQYSRVVAAYRAMKPVTDSWVRRYGPGAGDPYWMTHWDLVDSGIPSKTLHRLLPLDAQWWTAMMSDAGLPPNEEDALRYIERRALGGAVSSGR